MKLWLIATAAFGLFVCCQAQARRRGPKVSFQGWNQDDEGSGYHTVLGDQIHVRLDRLVETVSVILAKAQNYFNDNGLPALGKLAGNLNAYIAEYDQADRSTKNKMRPGGSKKRPNYVRCQPNDPRPQCKKGYRG